MRLISVFKPLGDRFRIRPFPTSTFHTTIDSFRDASFIDFTFLLVRDTYLVTLIHNMSYTLYSEYGLTIVDRCKEVKLIFGSCVSAH